MYDYRRKKKNCIQQFPVLIRRLIKKYGNKIQIKTIYIHTCTKALLKIYKRFFLFHFSTIHLIDTLMAYNVVFSARFV